MLAWNWEHDADFVRLLADICQAKDMILLEITPRNREQVLGDIEHDLLRCRLYFDRASDEDASFIPIERWAREHHICRINPRENAIRAWDKAEMHYALIEAGLNTPHTIVIPSFEEHLDLPPIDLAPLGNSFVIKPAHGGSGEGVITGASSWHEVISARQQYPDDQYLLQEMITPVMLGSHPGWFRIIYCTGSSYPCWWNPDTHVYLPLSWEEEIGYQLAPLRQLTARIASVCGLNLFSTEITVDSQGNFVVVDYVNDQIDLRLQSKTHDGVPDIIARNIAEHLVGFAQLQNCQPDAAEDVPSASSPGDDLP